MVRRPLTLELGRQRGEVKGMRSGRRDSPVGCGFYSCNSRSADRRLSEGPTDCPAEYRVGLGKPADPGEAAAQVQVSVVGGRGQAVARKLISSRIYFWRPAAGTP